MPNMTMIPVDEKERLIEENARMYGALKQCSYILDKIACGMGYHLMSKVVDDALDKVES